MNLIATVLLDFKRFLAGRNDLAARILKVSPTSVVGYNTGGMGVYYFAAWEPVFNWFLAG